MLSCQRGSTEELQLATVAEAERILTDEVITPALAADPGLAQLAAVCEAFTMIRRCWTWPATSSDGG